MKTLLKTHNLDFEFFDAIDSTSKPITNIATTLRHRYGLEIEEEIPFASWQQLTVNETENVPLDCYSPKSVGADSFWQTPSRAAHLPKSEATLSKSRFMHMPALAVWQSHYMVLRKIIEDGSQSALIMEDDIDVEWDFGQHARDIMHGMNGVDWDVLYLGHCWSDEDDYPPIPQSPEWFTIHPSSKPQCLHGYAVSAAGARRLVSLLRDPKFAYSRPIDHAVPYLIAKHLIKSFSVVPALITQAKGVLSDLGDNRQDTLRQHRLVDSSLVRLGLATSSALEATSEEHRLLAWRLKNVKNGWQYDGA